MKAASKAAAKKVSTAPVPNFNPLTHAIDAVDVAIYGEGCITQTIHYFRALEELANVDGLPQGELHKRFSVVQDLAHTAFRAAEQFESNFEQRRTDLEIVVDLLRQQTDIASFVRPIDQLDQWIRITPETMPTERGPFDVFVTSDDWVYRAYLDLDEKKWTNDLDGSEFIGADGITHYRIGSRPAISAKGGVR
jgi:hypothetical protein